jgi:glycosyltransferase involved in cell wall biosynthesis
MALGIPVICLDWGGPGVIVDEATGIKVVPSTYAGTVTGLADAIGLMAANIADGKISEISCKERAFEVFSWACLATSISDMYEEIV